MGDFTLNVSYLPDFRVAVQTNILDRIRRPLSRRQSNGYSIVEGYFQIYVDAYMVEVQDKHSGSLAQRTLCVCVPGLRHHQPCRSASRSWLRQ